MGGKSKSSTSTQQTTKDLTTVNVDNRVASGDGGAIEGNTNFNVSDASSVSEVNITKTDFGAVAGGVQTALYALEQGGQSLQDLLDAGGEVFADTLNLAKSSQEQSSSVADASLELAKATASNDNLQSLQDILKWGTVALLGAGLLYVALKRRK